MREKLLMQLADEAKKSTSDVYDIAVMDESGISAVRPVFSSYAHDYYSVAKAFITAGILVLFDQKKLSPDDFIYPVLKPYFPASYDKNWEKVRVRDCITHRMGISRGFLDIDCENQLDFGNDWLKYSFSNIDIVNEPGEVFCYSDGAFYILGRIIEEISGIEASRFIARYITNPMEFRDNAWTMDPDGHVVGGSGFYASAEDAVKLPWLYVNGGVYKGKQIISQETVFLALRNDFGLSRCSGRNIYTKGGMYGQIVLADCDNRLAVSWHSFDRDGICDRLSDIVSHFRP